MILDPAGRALLVRFAFPDRVVWACPGGGIEEGEEPSEAIIRELAEETGLVIVEPGPPIWRREHVFPSAIEVLDGRWDGQAEQFFLVRSEAFEPEPRFSAEALAAEYVTGLRWWTASELDGADGVVFAPGALPELLAPLRRGEVPDPAIEVGV